MPNTQQAAQAARLHQRQNTAQNKSRKSPSGLMGQGIQAAKTFGRRDRSKSGIKQAAGVGAKLAGGSAVTALTGGNVLAGAVAGNVAQKAVENPWLAIVAVIILALLSLLPSIILFFSAAMSVIYIVIIAQRFGLL